MLESWKAWLAQLGLGAAGRVLTAVFVLIVGVFVIRMVMLLVKRTVAATKLEKAAHTLILSLMRVVMYLLLGLSVASSLGIDITGIVALASVLTLAISLSLQNILTNVLGGFTLLSTHPFRSGDYVEIAGQAGTVNEINMTYTKLVTFDNKHVSIPNSAVVAAQIVNYSAGGTRRGSVDIRVPYEIPTQKVIDALLIAGTADNVLLEPAPSAVLSGYGESAINYSLRFWAKNEDYWDVYFTINQRVYRIFQEQQIPFACPRVEVRMDK